MPSGASARLREKRSRGKIWRTARGAGAAGRWLKGCALRAQRIPAFDKHLRADRALNQKAVEVKQTERARRGAAVVARSTKVQLDEKELASLKLRVYIRSRDGA